MAKFDIEADIEARIISTLISKFGDTEIDTKINLGLIFNFDELDGLEFELDLEDEFFVDICNEGDISDYSVFQLVNLIKSEM
jgi:hypothetical protein